MSTKQLTFRIFDVVLDSDIPFPELPPTTQKAPTIRVRKGSANSDQETSAEWFHHFEDQNGQVCIAIGRCPDGYLLRFPGLLDAFVALDGKLVEYLPAECSSPDTIRHLILDQIIPRALGQQGRMVLHASAVVLPNGHTIAFLGGSGWGKSTLASSFHESGMRLITDDCLLIEISEQTVFGIPNYPGLRLYDDSAKIIFKDTVQFCDVAHYSPKKRLILREQEDHGQTKGIPISAIFFLVDPANITRQEISITPMKGPHQLMALTAQAFTLDPTTKKVARALFRKAGGITSSLVAFYELGYPRTHELLPRLRAKIQRIVTA